ncbi:MAG: polyphosphate kinase 2 family protein [Methanoregulaceae archaeon]|nr:polyphosphate kinase 2 family protein [Methanoregulaceae archaeon]
MAFTYEDLIKMVRVPPGKKIDMRKDYDPGFSAPGWTKEEANQKLEEGIRALAEWQDKLYADDSYAMLIVLQALDAAGKDGTIKHVMSGLNPQGVNVTSFKAPSSEELSHDYLWRQFKALPERGHIGIFNRSYYEEVLVTRVHPELLDNQNLPPTINKKGIWKQRYQEINNFEKYLVDNGIIVLKFFLHVSKDEQKKRFLERLTLPEKNWKFSTSDVRERQHWDEYIDAYEDLFNHTSTVWAPWYILPADHKWVTHLAVAAIIYFTLADLKVSYPTVSEEKKEELLLAKKMLEDEGIGKKGEKEDNGRQPEKEDTMSKPEEEGEKNKTGKKEKGKKPGKSKKKGNKKGKKS